MAKTLVHTDSRFHGKNLVLPIDGHVQLGPKGEVTVSDAAAKILLDIPNWVDAAAKGTGKLEKKEQKEQPKNKLHLEETDENQLADGVDLSDLDKLEIEQLLEIAAAAQLEVPGPMQTKKKALVTFLRAKLKEKIAAE